MDGSADADRVADMRAATEHLLDQELQRLDPIVRRAFEEFPCRVPHPLTGAMERLRAEFDRRQEAICEAMLGIQTLCDEIMDNDLRG